MRVLAVDPGVMTGYCYAAIKDQQLYYYPFQMTDEVDDFWRRLHSFNPRFIVMESFEFRGGARKGLNLFPMQLIGVARLYEALAPGPDNSGCSLFLQSAGQGKAYYTDTTLKTQSLYVRGIPHGMDASRHLLQWATFGYGHQYIGTNRTFATLVGEEAFAK